MKVKITCKDCLEVGGYKYIKVNDLKHARKIKRGLECVNPYTKETQRCVGNCCAII